MAGISVLVATLACIVVAGSDPLEHISSPDANSYSLKFIFNMTTSVYNGTDVSKAVARSELLVGMWSAKTPQLSDAAEKFASIQAMPGVDLAQMRSGALDSGKEEKGPLPLVYSYNITQEEIFGPKFFSIVYDVVLLIWAKK